MQSFIRFFRPASRRHLSTSSSNPLTERVLTYWYGDSRSSWYDTHHAMMPKWFKGGAEVDDEIRRMFSSDIEAALSGKISVNDGTWQDSIALVILLDQFTRNIYRGTAEAFSGDVHAVKIARNAATVDDITKILRPVERSFLFLPLMHSEEMADQQLAVQVFGAADMQLKEDNHEEAQGLRVFSGKQLEMAVDHREIIKQFGRFPHRNKALGRQSTPEEVEYLKDANTYGQ